MSSHIWRSAGLRQNERTLGEWCGRQSYKKTHKVRKDEPDENNLGLGIAGDDTLNVGWSLVTALDFIYHVVTLMSCIWRGGPSDMMLLDLPQCQQNVSWTTLRAHPLKWRSQYKDQVWALPAKIGKQLFALPLWLIQSTSILGLSSFVPTVSPSSVILQICDAEKRVHTFVSSVRDHCCALLTGIPFKSLQKLQHLMNNSAGLLIRVQTVPYGFVLNYFHVSWSAAPAAPVSSALCFRPQPEAQPESAVSAHQSISTLQ